MNSPDRATPVSVKQEEPEDQPHLKLPHMKEEQEELLLRPGEHDGSMLTLLAVKKEDDDEDIASHCTEIVECEVELESDSEDSDDWEETSRDLQKQIERSDIYCQMLRNGQILSAGFQQITNSVTSIKQGDTDQPQSSSHHHFNKTLTQPGDVKTHQMIFTEKKAHICITCDRSFSRLQDLKMHQDAHSAQLLQCKQCGKSFVRSYNLKRHKCIQTGEQSLHCEICDKSYCDSSTLKKHYQRIHIRENPFYCKHCDKSFIDSGSLKRHQDIHTGEKPFHCEVCDESFIRLRSLKIHQRTSFSHLGALMKQLTAYPH